MYKFTDLAHEIPENHMYYIPTGENYSTRFRLHRHPTNLAVNNNIAKNMSAGWKVKFSILINAHNLQQKGVFLCRISVNNFL